MGKVRVTVIGDEEAELKQKEEQKRKRGAKKAAEFAAEKTEEKQTEEPASEVIEEPKKEKNIKKTVTSDKKQGRSDRYLKAKELVEENKLYSLSSALEILIKMPSKFDETVELHLNTNSQGISGQVTLPHGSGKQTRVAIATDELIAEVEKGKIDFDILVADPSMMPKLAKVAKVLGPRGLMPNPKSGTISPKPEEVVKKYQGGQITFKTEGKAPLMHLSVGKVSFGQEKLSENIKTVISAVKKENIKKAVLKSTMSPSIKLQV